MPKKCLGIFCTGVVALQIFVEQSHDFQHEADALAFFYDPPWIDRGRRAHIPKEILPVNFLQNLLTERDSPQAEIFGVHQIAAVGLHDSISTGGEQTVD